MRQAQAIRPAQAIELARDTRSGAGISNCINMSRRKQRVDRGHAIDARHEVGHGQRLCASHGIGASHGANACRGANASSGAGPAQTHQLGASHVGQGDGKAMARHNSPEPMTTNRPKRRARAAEASRSCAVGMSNLSIRMSRSRVRLATCDDVSCPDGKAGCLGDGYCRTTCIIGVVVAVVSVVVSVRQPRRFRRRLQPCFRRCCRLRCCCLSVVVVSVVSVVVSVAVAMCCIRRDRPKLL